MRLAASADTLAVVSMVCCETWQEPLLALRLFSLSSGELRRTVKELEDGRKVRGQKRRYQVIFPS